MKNAHVSSAASPRQARPNRRARNGFVAALELVVKHGRATFARPSEAPYRKRCPKCGWTGLTDQDFGMRTLRGRRVPQSWCRLCRKSAAEADSAKKKSGTDTKAKPMESAWLFPSL